MIDENMIFCAQCGATNPLESEICSACGNELSRPHPIQIAGGEIYTLRCGQCGQRLPVVKAQGTITCVSCGMVHTIESGPGYLTVRATPGASPNETEEEYLLSDTPPISGTAIPALNPEIQAMAAAQTQNLRRSKDLEIGIKVKSTQLKQRASRRTGGVVITLIAAVGIVFSIIDGMNRTVRYGLVDPLIFFFSGIFFFIGLVLLLASGKKKDRKLQQEIAGMNEELSRLSGSTLEGRS
jgi:hypothetical protein